MVVSMAIPIVLFVVAIKLTHHLMKTKEEYKRIFSAFALSILPLAFAYHIAHNLTHMVRESGGFWGVVFDPLGKNALPLSKFAQDMCQPISLIANDTVFSLQAILVIFGFWLALRIAKQRFQQITAESNGIAFIPVLVFISIISLGNLWLLMQPMIMRM
jgi:hypothetical protein